LPPEFPRYNGAIEAGIGSLKTRVFFEAGRHDRPCDWTCDDAEAGQRQANDLARPNGHLEPTLVQHVSGTHLPVQLFPSKLVHDLAERSSPPNASLKWPLLE
jgi:hypothetical protein